MLALIQICGLFGLLLAPVVAHISEGRRGYGVIGYGISMYDPPCAYACRDTVTAWMLDCEDGTGAGGGHHHDGGDMEGMESPSPECYTSNDPFLQTLAWCISTHCEGISMSRLEEFWDLNVAGRMEVQPLPKYSYQKALQLVTEPPTNITSADDILTGPSLVDDETYLSSYNGDRGFEKMEIRTSTYAYVLPIYSHC